MNIARLIQNTLNFKNIKKIFKLYNTYSFSEATSILQQKKKLAFSFEKSLKKGTHSKYGVRRASLLEASYPGITQPVGLYNLPVLEEKFKKPNFKIRNDEPVRINVLLPNLDPLIMFGGYIACLHFIKKLCSMGYRVRILLVESEKFDRVSVIEKLSKSPEIQELISKLEVECIQNSSYEIKISSKDDFMGYSFWTCIKAHIMAEAIGKTFIFFIQEYEPVFHPFESQYAIGNYVYRLPHLAIFNTQLLADYFMEHKIGVFGHYTTGEKKKNHIVFQHALTPTSIPLKKTLAQKKQKRLLFYGRPENHARRNLFEIGIMGLRHAIKNNVFHGDWEFLGIGTLGLEFNVDLGSGYSIRLSSTLPQSDYAAALSEFDIGLSLMLAPHPGIITFEMASAGQIVVTNTFETRTEEILRGISCNIEPCEADHFSVAHALKRAVTRLDDHQSRVEGAKLNWANSWDDAFNQTFLDDFSQMIS
jgi:hypothetical protein